MRASTFRMTSLNLFRHSFGFTRVLLALLMLLAGQFGAQVHTYAHEGTAVAAHQKVVDAHLPCKDCLAYAPLLATAGAPASIATPGERVAGIRLSRTQAPAAAARLQLAFRSRAPPHPPRFS